MGQGKKIELTHEELKLLKKLCLKGGGYFVKYKTPRRSQVRKEEFPWMLEIARLIKTLKHTPRQAQIAVSKMKKFREWNCKKSKVKQKQDQQHYKDLENMFNRWLRTGGILTTLKRNKKGSVKGVAKKKKSKTDKFIKEETFES